MRKAISHLKRSDPVLSAVIRTVGPYRMEYRDPEFSTLVRSIVYQQVSGKAAATIFGRLLDACSRELMPERIVTLSDTELRAVGLSGQKARYVRELALHALDGRVDFALLNSLTDDEVIVTLTRVKGIGVWTAQMFLMFALRRLDVLPTADLGIRAAMKRLYGLEELPRAAEMERIAAPWRPYASVACWYLWRSLDGQAAL